MTEKLITIGNTRQLIDINENKRAFNLDISVEAKDPNAIFRGLIITQQELDEGTPPQYRQFKGSMKAKIKNDGTVAQNHYLDLVSEIEVPCTVKISDFIQPQEGGMIPPPPGDTTPIGEDDDVQTDDFAQEDQIPEEQFYQPPQEEFQPPSEQESAYPFTSSRREQPVSIEETTKTPVVKKKLFTLKNCLLILAVVLIVGGIYYIWSKKPIKNTSLPPVPPKESPTKSAINIPTETATTASVTETAATPSVTETVVDTITTPSVTETVVDTTPAKSPNTQSLNNLMSELNKLTNSETSSE